MTSGTPVTIPTSITVDGEYLETLASGVTTLGDRYFSEQAEQEIEIIEIQANDSLSALDKGSMISDTFSDADGYNNTVDTGATTSTWETSLKEYVGKGVIAEFMNLAVSNASLTAKHGVFFTPSSDVTLIGFVKKSTSPITETLIHSGDGSTELGKVSHAGNASIVYFDEPIELIGSTQYSITGWIGGGAVTMIVDNARAGTWPIVNNGISFDVGCANFATNVNYNYNFEDLIFGADTFVEIDLPTITGTVLQTMLLVNGSQSVTYEIEDASANTDILLPIDIKNNIVNLVSSPVKLRINLNSLANKTYILVLIKS